MNLQGKIALVTGASGGIGRAMAMVVAFLASPDAGWVTGQYVEASSGTLFQRAARRRAVVSAIGNRERLWEGLTGDPEFMRGNGRRRHE
jgi:hypothetical protein